MHVCILLYIRFIFCLVVFFYYPAIYTVYKRLKCLVYICSFEATYSLKTGLILFCCEYVHLFPLASYVYLALRILFLPWHLLVTVIAQQFYLQKI